ncbi:N-acetylmuramidase domain-containing protein [Burkholderia glumae]|uniref:N-acetylmuramidase domain-containing protein n=1 Tax=Burkholderia glumae TaxID=337 RepID=UPI0026E51DE9|nr:N-acetylmuramidase domain-containing protein [Burkholderia glumae]MCQ0033125.1 N-acetylmuramidase domain-containing protein [Burkholderia glumae]MCQ0038158.1 N-acetylmuramidase domain-containing protein [Burkholderia glumae]
MNSFVATAAPAVAASPIDGTLTNDGFFPDIDLSALRDAMRLDGTVTRERLRHAARDAMLTVNDELAAWRTRQRAAGAGSLADVSAERVDGESVHVFQVMGYHWKRLGYASVDEFVARMETSEGDQLDGFVRFVAADSSLLSALKNRKWAAFAKGYNGPDYARNLYDAKLAQAYERYAGTKAAA